MVGTQIANNLASFSNDGMMCVWDVKQFSKPVKFNRLTAIQATRAVKQSKVSAIGVAGLSSIKTVKAETASSMIMEKVVKEEPYDINVICGKFPMGDANNYYVGSLNGALYKNALHNRSTDKITMYDEHDGPISSLSINNPSEHESLNGLVLTSSFDWTVKLWSPQAKQSLKTFENFEDFVYDVAWNPVNPSLFATVNNEGYLDIFDLTRDLELPIAHEKVSNYAQNKTMWNQNGSAIVSGDSSGALNMYILAEKYRKMDPTKSEDMEKALLQPRDDS